MSNDERITRFMTGNIGVHVGTVHALLQGGSETRRQQLAEELLERGSALVEAEAAVRQAEARVRELEALLDREREAHRATRAKVPPESPVRLFGAGIIRTDREGYPWVMNKLEPGAGWGTVGLRFDSWDSLFRRFAVRIVAGHVDEHGPFFRFETEPAKARPEGPSAPTLRPEYGWQPSPPAAARAPLRHNTAHIDREPEIR